eukprot:354060-Chlamydomonas_euryale.AAC.2
MWDTRKNIRQGGGVLNLRVRLPAPGIVQGMRRSHHDDMTCARGVPHKSGLVRPCHSLVEVGCPAMCRDYRQDFYLLHMPFRQLKSVFHQSGHIRRGFSGLEEK